MGARGRFVKIDVCMLMGTVRLRGRNGCSRRETGRSRVGPTSKMRPKPKRSS